MDLRVTADDLLDILGIEILATDDEQIFFAANNKQLLFVDEA